MKISFLELRTLLAACQDRLVALADQYLIESDVYKESSDMYERLEKQLSKRKYANCSMRKRV